MFTINVRLVVSCSTLVARAQGTTTAREHRVLGATIGERLRNARRLILLRREVNVPSDRLISRLGKMYKNKTHKSISWSILPG